VLLPLESLRLRQASTSRLSRRRRKHRGAWTGLLGQQLPLQLLSLVMSHRHQLRGIHAHRGGGSSSGGGSGSYVTQLRMLLRMMMARCYCCCCRQTGLTSQPREHADVRRQSANRGTSCGGQIGGGSGEARILAPLGSHVLGPAPPSPPGGGARGLLASLAHCGALLVLLLLTGVLRSLNTCSCTRLTSLHSLKECSNVKSVNTLL